jgi:hypothetical protein
VCTAPAASFQAGTSFFSSPPRVEKEMAQAFCLCVFFGREGRGGA